MAARKKKAPAGALTFDAPTLEPSEFTPVRSVQRISTGEIGTYRNKIKNTIYHYVSLDDGLHCWEDNDIQEVPA